ncbi:RDD family protein [Desulfococcaceae bacterium HSG8]|nr:RDD family protein [Desulfococcaceae bacterium HSG8]
MKLYYADGNQQVGPITGNEFEARLKAKKIKAKTLIWCSGMPDWQEYKAVKKQITALIASEADEEASRSEGSVCSECGRTFFPEEMIRYGDSWVCAACKPAFVQKLKEGVPLEGVMEYAGFWVRFAAKFVDGFILGILNTALSSVGAFLIPESSAGVIILSVIQIVVGAVYTAWFLGRYGATPGKMACKIKVVKADRGKISYARGLGRHFAEWLSAIILMIGYIIAAFDEEKRTLHDRICNTRVIRK